MRHVSRDLVSVTEPHREDNGGKACGAAVRCYLKKQVKCAEVIATKFCLFEFEFLSLHVSLFHKIMGSVREVIFLMSLIILSAIYNILSNRVV